QYVDAKKNGRTTAPKETVQQGAHVTVHTHPEPNIMQVKPEQQLQTIYSGNVEIIELDRMRRLIAEHMVRSKHTSPHVTSFTESDVTNLVLWRERVKKDFEKRENEKITFTPLFIE